MSKPELPSIDRRDFLQGAALTVGASLALTGAQARTPALDGGPDGTPLSPLQRAGITQQDPRYYPPELTGMRGSHAGSYPVAHLLRDEGGWAGDKGVDTGERYDLVVVGAGNSGLGAAYAYRRKHPEARILVIDNHDDFGGHAKRNEFVVDGRKLIGYGGSQSITTNYPQEVLSLMSEAGINLRSFTKYWDKDFRRRNGLMTGMFFNAESFGRNHLARGMVDLPAAQVFADVPMSEQGRKDMIRIMSQRIDYLEGMALDEKIELLMSISFEEFLVKYVKVDPDVVKFFHSVNCEVSGHGADASVAFLALTAGTWDATYPETISMTWNLVEGMHLGIVPEDSWGYVCHFPDGNAGIARSFVRGLVPDAVPGTTMEDLVTSKISYPLLDKPGAPARVRLSSTAVKVEHLGNPATAREVEVTYQRYGKTERVRAGGVIMACYNMIVPRIIPSLPQKQKDALQYQVKVPLVYTNVAIRNWRAIKALGVDQAYCPNSFYYSVIMDFPVSMGDYRYTASPDEPVLLHMVTHIPTPRDIPPRDQRRAARAFLYSTPFEVFEKNAHQQLDAMFGAGGFKAARDIAGITVNRWPHGYADSLRGLDDPKWAPGEAPNEIGRQRFGRIAIANSDAGAESNSGAAIAEGMRAVQELG